MYTAGKSTSGIHGQFVFSQVLIDCLLRLKLTEADREELIDHCKKQYKDNNIELKNLREFRKEYSSEKALWWYTRESFLYKTLNAVLRNEDIHMTFLLRGFIRDIYCQLQKYQAQSPLKVYRGQMISSKELENLRKCCGKFISINSFFSTSINRKSAVLFIKNYAATENLEPILFEIDADPKLALTKPFADISSHSEFSKECEVLLMLGSVFRLNSIQSPPDSQFSIIRMTLCGDNEHDLKDILIYMKEEFGSGETSLRTLGKVLDKMGKFDLAERYFTRLLKEISPDDPLLPHLYKELSDVASHAGNFDKSMEWKKKLLAQGPIIDVEQKISMGKLHETKPII